MMIMMMMKIMMIMRILMLPTNEVGPKRQAGDCSQCASLKEITGQVIIPYPVTVQCNDNTISAQVETLIACAEKKDEEPEGDDGEAPAADDGGDAAPADDGGEADADVAEPPECPPPEMFIMSLISLVESIDGEIENLYTLIIKSTDDEERTKYSDELQDYKSKRDVIDDLITKLTDEEDAEKIKKAVKRGLGRIGGALKSQLAECQSQCDTGGRSVN